jgi:hypothetical protein
MLKRLHAIVDEQTCLEEKLEENREQRVDDPQGEVLLQELIAMERAPCRPLCDAMQQYLPRELRDMVYEHIAGPAAWQNNQRIVPVMASKDPSTTGGFELLRIGSTAFDIGDLNHLDDATREELAEYWHKTSTFDFCTDWHLIKHFLKAEAVGTKRRVLDLVRHLEITIDCDDDEDIDEEKEKLLTQALADLPLLARPARLRMYLDDITGITRHENDRFILLLPKVLQLLPELPGWTIEFVVQIVTDKFQPSEPGQDAVNGYKVSMVIPGRAETSLNEWSDTFKHVSDEPILSKFNQLTLDAQLREQLEQYYNNTLNEPDEIAEVDDEYAEEDESDDESDEYLLLSRDERLDLKEEVEWCHIRRYGYVLPDEAWDGTWEGR